VSSSRLSEKDNEFLARVDEVLHYLWDPIGINGIPEARDEYSSYAGVVFSMLKRGASEHDVSKYLTNIRADHMGMGRPEESSREKEIAEILANWKDKIFSDPA
jgi:hypothetical protein